MIEDPHPDCYATHVDDPQRLEQLAESAECAWLFLGDQQVPCVDSQGQALSLVGRILLYGRMQKD